jgi:alkylation response protein AidB-like acyl-CoA dehydrogenase
MTVDAAARRDLDSEAFRSELRAFLDDHLRVRSSDQPRGDAELEWAGTLVDRGWAAPGWPLEFGGMDLPTSLQVVYHEEMTRARAPAHPCPVNFVVGPTLIVHGTPAQHRQHLDPLLRGTARWCQGFSEPEAGSDLTSLRTRAVRDGDHYVVDGQKVWTTRAQDADWMFALVRTGAPGADGISYLLIDMRSRGITVRPLRDMSGASHFSQVFFEHVRVPVANLVGEENAGWRIARTSLGHERATAFIAQEYRYRRIVEELVALARRQGRLDEPVVRQELARCAAAIRILSVTGHRTLARVLARDEPGPEASVSRLAASQFEQRLHEVAVDLLGPYGQLDIAEPDAVQRGRWVFGFLRTRASTIGAGTAEIQRNTIAEKLLGLPADLRPHPEEP